MKQAKMRTKGRKILPNAEFVSIAAHQLRTPLIGLKWSLEILSSGEAGKLNPDQKQIIAKASVATSHMLNLVSDLLNVGQIAQGSFGVIFKKQSILPVFKNLKDSFKNIGEEKKVAFKFEIPPDLPPLNVDIEKMEMAINNIFDNAIKYSSPGDKVELEVVCNDHTLVISVKDMGIGIPKEEFGKIFTKFFRSTRALHHHTDGTGLGLYVSKNIIEQHGGKIWFESKENQGTTFFVSLPVP